MNNLESDLEGDLLKEMQFAFVMENDVLAIAGDGGSAVPIPNETTDEDEAEDGPSSDYAPTQRGLKKAIKKCTKSIQMLQEQTDGLLGAGIIDAFRRMNVIINTVQGTKNEAGETEKFPYADIIENIEALREGIIRLIGQIHIRRSNSDTPQEQLPYCSYDYAFSMQEGHGKIGKSPGDRYMEMLFLNTTFNRDIKEVILQDMPKRHWTQAAIEIPYTNLSQKKSGRPRKNG